MGRGTSRQGEDARQRILRELARIYLEFELPCTWDGLAADLGMSTGTLRHHVNRLRLLGFVHRDGLWITREGLDQITTNLEP